MNQFYINELLRAKLWPLIHIISNTEFGQLAVFVRKALSSIMSCQSSQVRLLLLSAMRPTLVLAVFLTTPLLLPKSSPSSTVQSGGKFWANPGPEEAAQKIPTPSWDWDCFTGVPAHSAERCGCPSFTRPLPGLRRTVLIFGYVFGLPHVPTIIIYVCLFVFWT